MARNSNGAFSSPASNSRSLGLQFSYVLGPENLAAARRFEGSLFLGVRD